MNLIGIQASACVNHFIPGRFGLGNKAKSLFRCMRGLFNGGYHKGVGRYTQLMGCVGGTLF